MEDMRKKNLTFGILIMILSSVCTCTGQLMWKLAAGHNALLLCIVGFFFYGLGALLMMFALKYGELSVLHPMLSFGFILSMILGAAVLHEAIGSMKILGILFIIFGMIFLARSGRKETGK